MQEQEEEEEEIERERGRKGAFFKGILNSLNALVYYTIDDVCKNVSFNKWCCNDNIYVMRPKLLNCQFYCNQNFITHTDNFMNANTSGNIECTVHSNNTDRFKWNSTHTF